MEKKLEIEPGPLDCLCNDSLHTLSESLVDESTIKTAFCENCYVVYNPKLDKCKCKDGVRKQKKFKNVVNVEYPSEPSRENTKEKAVLFLEKKKISDFFNFLISHLLVKRPEDPIEFLIDLLNDCMYFRAGIKKPPLLYEATHLQGMVACFDPINQSSLTWDQYKTAFATLGLTNYNKCPPMTSNNQICGSTFVSEAEDRLTDHLASMIQVHNDEERNDCEC